MSDYTIRQATAEDAAQFYGQQPQKTMRGFVLVDSAGEVVGIAGTYHDGNYLVAFSEMKEHVHARKKDIVRMARAMMSDIEARGKPVIAIASPKEPNSEAFIQRFGFVFVDRCAIGALYAWSPGEKHA